VVILPSVDGDNPHTDQLGEYMLGQSVLEPPTAYGPGCYVPHSRPPYRFYRIGSIGSQIPPRSSGMAPRSDDCGEERPGHLPLPSLPATPS